MAKTEKEKGLILSSSALPTIGEYHIPLKVSSKHSLIGLQSYTKQSSNCVYWNNGGIFINGVQHSDEVITEGKVGIDVKAKGPNVVIQFTEERKVGKAISIKASDPIYLAGWVASSPKTTVEILTS